MKQEIKSVSKLFLLLVSVGNAAGTVFEDGKISVSDVSALFKLSSVINLFAEIDFKLLLPEFADLNDAELKELQEIVKTLDLPQKGLESKIEGLYSGVSAIYKAVASLVDALK